MKQIIKKILKENKEEIYLNYVIENVINHHVNIEKGPMNFGNEESYFAVFQLPNDEWDTFDKRALAKWMNEPLNTSNEFDTSFLKTLEKYGVKNIKTANLIWKLVCKEIIRRIELLEKSNINESDNSKRDKFIRVVADDIFTKTYFNQALIYNIVTPFDYTLSTSWFKKTKSERILERPFINRFYRYVSETYGININDGYFIEKVMSLYFDLITNKVKDISQLNESDDFKQKIKNNIYKYLDRKYVVYYPKYFRQDEKYDWAIKSKDGDETPNFGSVAREIKEVFNLDGFTSLELAKIWVGRNLKVLKEKQHNLDEDLEYYGVDDASPESDNYELGLTEDVPIYKEHNLGKKMYQRLRNHYPDTPEYVLKDYFYNNIVNEFDTIQKDYYGDPVLATRGYWDSYLKGPWKLQILTVNPEDFDDRTVNAFLERDFGNIDTYQVPDDEERTKIQRRLAKPTGMNEPVIVELKPDGKYELIEGWHRTMSILLLGDNGEDLKNWEKVKIRAFVRYPNH